MARKDSEHQKKSMSRLFRGKAIFKPLNTGRIDERVACVREWIANIFFYTIMSERRYGDMEAFAEKLRGMGYEAVRLIDTTDGTFLGKKEAAWLDLAGSTLLVGRK